MIITVIRPLFHILKITKIRCRQDSYNEKIVHISNVTVYVISVYFLHRYISKEESEKCPQIRPAKAT